MAEAATKTKDQPSGTKPAPAPVPLTQAEKRLKAIEARERFLEIAPKVTAALDLVSPGARAPVIASEHTPDLVKEALSIMPDAKRNDLQLSEFTNTSWRRLVDSEIDLRLLDGNAKDWSIYSDMLKPFDSVRVVSANRAAVADFIVIDCDENYANARLTFYMKVPVRATESPAWMPEGYSLVRLGPEAAIPGWAVKRLEDGHLLTDGGVPFQDVETARRFIKDHAIFRRDEAPRYFPR